MHRLHPASEFVKLFPSEEIPRIIQNILQGCKTLKREIPAELENQLTSRLFRKLISFPDYRIGPLTVVPQWESSIINFSKDEAQIKGRADILFIFPGGGLETYFLVEAKRLFVTSKNGKISSLTGKYIDDGMMRFAVGQYASKMTSGAMLGYVFDKHIDDAIIALSAAINKKSKSLNIIENGEWQKSSLPVSPQVNETRHEFSQGKFTIYHILTQV